MLITVYLVQSKDIKKPQQEIPSISLNTLEFFCALLYIDYFSDFEKQFQVASTYGVNVK